MSKHASFTIHILSDSAHALKALRDRFSRIVIEFANSGFNKTVSIGKNEEVDFVTLFFMVFMEEEITIVDFTPDPIQWYFFFIMALDFIAGCLGGCAGVLVGHPFDTVKVHLQTQDGKKPLYRGTWHCMSSIIKAESVNGLYRGVSSPMAGIAFINAIVFGVYGNVQRQFIDATSLTSHFVAGFTAGTVQSFVCSPMELAKTRMQLQSKWKLTSKNPISYRGPLDCLVKMYKSEGNRGVFRGLGCSILRDSPAFGVYFASYEFLCQKMETQNGISTPVMMVAGGVAGILSWVATYPVDLIKSRLQADGMNGVRKYAGIIDCALKSYHTEGIKVFTRGLGSTIIRAFPTNAATLTVVTWIFRLSSQQESLELRRDKHTPSILEKDIQRVTTCVDTYI